MSGFLWDDDLQALVNGHHPAAVAAQPEGFSSVDYHHLGSLRINEEAYNNINNHQGFAFPDFSAVNNSSQSSIHLYRELEDIYKPFYQPCFNNFNTSTTAIMGPPPPPPPPPPQMTPILPPIPNFPNYPSQDTFEKQDQNSLPLPQSQPLPPSPLPPPKPEQAVQEARPRPRGQAPASGGPANRNTSIKKSPAKVKKVCEVKATKLFDDLWAWRKYGQKPIKGSPFPRNYYRCSSSKGCSARKQVEKSSQGVDMFTVTYTGEHTHPRPPNRILGTSGCGRNKLPSVSTNNRPRTRKTARNNHNKNANPLVQKNGNNFTKDPFMTAARYAISSSDNAFGAAPSSYGYSSSILSPNTPLNISEQPMGGGEGKLTLDELEELLEEDFDGEEDEEMVMIPNMAINEDLFMGFQELGWPIPDNWGKSFNPPAFGYDGSSIGGKNNGGGRF